MKGKRYNNKKQYRKIILTILFLIFIAIMIISGTMILKRAKENKESNDIIEDISESISIDENIDNIEKYNISFEELKQTNSDTIAWLKVNGTDIENPVVKTTNNDFYMTHSFDKSYNSAGWVFMDYKNKFDGTDNNKYRVVLHAKKR